MLPRLRSLPGDLSQWRRNRSGCDTCRRGGRADVLEHGTDWQKEKFLLRILTGEDIWCQLFSEPGSGSDVAGAVTRAEFRGNQWVVNGQKVWTTATTAC